MQLEQAYNPKDMSFITDPILGRKILAEMLGFVKHRVEKGWFTLEEMSMLGHFADCVPIYATVEDLASYYGKSETAIRSVIHRRMMSKPKRRVLYDFHEFQRVVPDKWRK